MESTRPHVKETHIDLATVTRWPPSRSRRSARTERHRAFGAAGRCSVGLAGTHGDPCWRRGIRAIREHCAGRSRWTQ
jgi:hypothetical protein